VRSGRAQSDIPIGHKLAIRALAASETVVSTVDIGRAVAPIKVGEHAHVHNIKTSAGEDMSVDLKNRDVSRLQTRERPRRRAQPRRHPAVDDLSNASCEAVANHVKGALAIPHPYGASVRATGAAFQDLIGTGANPNVAAVVVIGIEDGWAKRCRRRHREDGNPSPFFGIEATATWNDTARLAQGERVRALGVRAAPRGAAAGRPVVRQCASPTRLRA